MTAAWTPETMAKATDYALEIYDEVFATTMEQVEERRLTSYDCHPAAMRAAVEAAAVALSADAGLRARVTALRDEAREEAERPDGDYAFRAANVRRALDAILAETATEETTPPACPNHEPIQHRDRQPPWCRRCGWTSAKPAVPARQINAGESS